MEASSPQVLKGPAGPPRGAAFFTWVASVFLAGASDRFFVRAGVPYQEQIWCGRIAVFVLPVLVFSPDEAALPRAPKRASRRARESARLGGR